MYVESWNLIQLDGYGNRPSGARESERGRSGGMKPGFGAGELVESNLGEDVCRQSQVVEW
jgi:hypothetical protein